MNLGAKLIKMNLGLKLISMSLAMKLIFWMWLGIHPYIIHMGVVRHTCTFQKRFLILTLQYGKIGLSYDRK